MKEDMDINFFEPIRKKKKKSNHVPLLIFFAMFIMLALLISLCIVKKSEHEGLKRKLNDINSMMDDPAFRERLKSMQSKEKEVEENTEKYAYLLTLASAVSGHHTVQEEVLQALMDELTKTLYLEKVNITGDQLTLDGYAENIPDITQFEYNLRHCGLFEDVIMNMVEEEKVTCFFSGIEIAEKLYSYKFNIQLTISNSRIQLLMKQIKEMSSAKE